MAVRPITLGDSQGWFGRRIRNGGDWTLGHIIQPLRGYFRWCVFLSLPLTHTLSLTHYPPLGASVLHNERLYRDAYLYCARMVEELHDSMDVNIVPGLLLMAGHAMMVFEINRARALALSYMIIAESICETLGATHTDVSFSHSSLTHHIIMNTRSLRTGTHSPRTDTHTHTRSLSLTLTLAHSHSNSLTLTRSLAHSLTLTHTHTCSLTLAHSHSHSQLLTYTHPLTLTLKNTHTRSLSLTLTLTRALAALTLTLTHTNTCTHAHHHISSYSHSLEHNSSMHK